MDTKLPGNDLYVGDVLLANASGELTGSGYYKTYYVDVNAGADTNSGLSWTKALKHISPAIVLSNAAIAAGSKGWAARNRIFFKGDNNETDKETLITLPNKCDVIGVGSYDHRSYPVMIGNHVIGAGAYMGCRFINMGFKSLAAGGAIFTVPTTTSGLQFINCFFDGSTATAGTIGISLTAVELARIEGCEFIGAFSTAAIAIGAGESNGLVIRNNTILGAVNGITIASTMTTSVRGAIVDGNKIDVTTLGINDEADKAVISNNNINSAGGNGWAACAHFSIVRGSNNFITTANGVCYRVPLVAGAGALA
jgi:hypothetical protein